MWGADARRRRARHHDGRQGHGRRLPAQRRDLHRRAHAPPSRGRIRAPARRATAAIRSPPPPGSPPLEIILKEDLVANAERVGRGHARPARGAEGEVPRGRRGARQGPDARHRAGARTGGPRSRIGKDVTRALYQECLRRGLVAMTYAPRSASTRPSSSREDAALAGLAILDEALGAVVRRARPRVAGCCAGRDHRARQRRACTAICPGWRARDDVEIVAVTDAARRGARRRAEHLPGGALVRLGRGAARARRRSTSSTSARRPRATPR